MKVKFSLKSEELSFPPPHYNFAIVQCDFASSQAISLRVHLKTHGGEIQTNATNMTMPLLMQAIWGHIWKRTVEKSQTNAVSVIMHVLGQAIWDMCECDYGSCRASVGWNIKECRLEVWSMWS